MATPEGGQPLLLGHVAADGVDQAVGRGSRSATASDSSRRGAGCGTRSRSARGRPQPGQRRPRAAGRSSGWTSSQRTRCRPAPRAGSRGSTSQAALTWTNAEPVALGPEDRRRGPAPAGRSGRASPGPACAREMSRATTRPSVSGRVWIRLTLTLTGIGSPSARFSDEALAGVVEPADLVGLDQLLEDRRVGAAEEVPDPHPQRPPSARSRSAAGPPGWRRGPGGRPGRRGTGASFDSRNRQRAISSWRSDHRWEAPPHHPGGEGPGPAAPGAAHGRHRRRRDPEVSPDPRPQPV